MKVQVLFKKYVSFFLLIFSISCSSLNKENTESSIQKTMTLNTTKEIVWRALTNKVELSQWWGKGVKLEARHDGAFYEPWGKGQLATGKVLEVSPLKLIKFTWHEKYWKDKQKTVCLFLIKEVSGKTILEVHHSGWETFGDVKKRTQLIKGFNGGWTPYFLNSKIIQRGWPQAAIFKS